jgi:hypothetical protein
MCFWQAWRERNNRERLGMVVSGKLSGAAADRRIDLHVELDPKQLLMRNTGDHVFCATERPGRNRCGRKTMLRDEWVRAAI